MAVDILAIADTARKAKNNNPEVIDATLGMFYDENKELVIPYVRKQFYKLDAEEIFPYGSTSGGDKFKENLISWVFYQEENEMRKNFKIDALATPGGSGALSIIFNTYGKKDDFILIPEPRWRYEFFTDAASKKIASYDLFLGENFNIEGLTKQLDTLREKQETIILIMNDPCHNPTGYQLKYSEWDSLINVLNTYKENKIVLVLDIAYADYNPEGFLEQRKKYVKLNKLNQHILPLITFSASKSFSIYGIRLGALIGLFKNSEDERYFKDKAYKDALGKWSTAPSVGVSLFNNIMEEKEAYIKTLSKVTYELKKRGKLFLEKAKELSVSHYPYSGGFFVLIKSTDPLKDYTLLTKKNVYVIPMEEGLRVALCSINLDEVERLVQVISLVISK